MSSFAAGTPQHSTLWLVVRCSRRATRQRCGHRHAGAVRRTSVSLAFCCPRTCVRGQHLIVPPTNAANAAARMQSQTRTKNSTNPSHLSSKQTPHISHSPAYKNTNPSHFTLLLSPESHFPRLPGRLSRLPASRLPAPGSRPAPIPALAPTLPVRPHPPSPQAPATLPPLHICQHICPSALVHCIRSFASHPHQRLPRASIHPALACASERREERGRLCRISGA